VTIPEQNTRKSQPETTDTPENPGLLVSGGRLFKFLLSGKVKAEKSRQVTTDTDGISRSR
jgi:hypothetical protein